MNWVKIIRNLGISLLLFVSCGDFEDEVVDINKTAKGFSCVIPNIVNSDSVVLISNTSDFANFCSAKLNHFQDSLLKAGWELEEESLDTRAVIDIRVDYVLYPTIDYNLDPPGYELFTARFGQQIVDSINSIVDNNYRISSNKTYVCEWRLILASYQALPSERVTSKASPMCALVPLTRNGYTQRGYTAYNNLETHEFLMSSYQLRIKYENVNHLTTVLDIDWPFPVRDSSGNGIRGYEFIYAVRTNN